MGRYLDAKCKLCRRAGEKLFLRGERCFSSKCAIVKRNYPPGVHGPAGAPRLTSYGLQLKEKQKAKRIFGLSEKQFKNYYLKAKRIKGDTSEIFLQLLERRLDNVVYRLGFAKSRNQARQLVSHRHILLNGRINNKPNTQVKVNDVISIKPSSRTKAIFRYLQDTLSKHETPNWLKLNPKDFSGQVIALPKMGDMQYNFDIKTIIEYYSR
jgi:small subunit ribosomal protein S4